MTKLPPDTQNPTTAAPQKPAEALSHQERVYFEMFRAIEQLGRKLEKAEAERYMLSCRLADIESSAQKDETTGRYYLPAQIIPQAAAAPQGLSRLAKGSIAASLVIALMSLGAVVMQDMPQKTERVQIAYSESVKTPRADTQTVWARNAEPAAEDVPAVQTASAETPAAAAEPAPQVDVSELTAQASEETTYLREAIADAPADTPIATHDEEAEDFDAHLAEALEDLPAETAETASVAAEEAVETVPEETATVEPAPAQTAAPVQIAAAETKKQPEHAAAKPVPAKQAVPQVTTSLPRVSRDESLPPALMAMQERAFEGVPEAQHDLAAIYAEGRRVRRDYNRARSWFAWAAAAGVANAHYNLAVMNHQGLGAPVNMPAALGHYSKAADLGHPEAMYNLGLYYTDKRSNGYNAARGVAFFKRAANAGVTQAAYNLGVIYESDMLGKPDIQSALEWYAVAAEEGNDDASLAVRRLKRQLSLRAAAQ